MQSQSFIAAAAANWLVAWQQCDMLLRLPTATTATATATLATANSNCVCICGCDRRRRWHLPPVAIRHATWHVVAVVAGNAGVQIAQKAPQQQRSNSKKLCATCTAAIYVKRLPLAAAAAAANSNSCWRCSCATLTNMPPRKLVSKHITRLCCSQWAWQASDCCPPAT